MLKILNRHSNGDRSSKERISIFDRRKRGESMRIPNNYTPDSRDYTKYTSCQTLNQNVIYEDDHAYNESDTTKNKFTKRYNSLTTLLMSSFRRAKSKKRQTELHDSKLDRHIAESNPVFRQKKSDYRNNSMMHSSQNGSITSLNSLSRPVIYKSVQAPYFQEKLNVLPNDEPDENDSDEEEPDASVPVCISVKMISNDFVDIPNKQLEPKRNAEPPTPKVRTLKTNQKPSENYEQFLRQKELNKSQVDRTYSSIHSINNTLSSNQYLTLEKQQKNNSIISVENSDHNLYSSILSSKNQSVSNQYLTDNSKTTRSQNYHSITDKILQASSLSLNTNPSFAQYLRVKNKSDQITEPNDILKRFSRHTKQQAPKPPRPTKTNSSSLSLKVTDSQKQDLQLTKPGPSTIKRSKTFTEQMQDMLNKAKSQNFEKANKKLTAEYVGNYSSFDKYKVSSSTLNNSHNMIGISCSKSSSNTKLKNSSFEDPDILNRISPINNVVEKPSYDEIDEIKDLVAVLAKQNEKFKKKFFECLMIKLWDTNLPLAEYLQLNKLMKALFGESYHKLDLSSISTATRPRKSSKIDYLTFSTTKNSKTDAEHIVNLMKTYLDAQSPEKQAEYVQAKLLQKDEDIDETNFITVSSLLDSLRVRQKVDEQAESKQYKSLLNLNSTSKYRSDLFESNDFSFKNGFNGLQNQQSNYQEPLKCERKGDSIYSYEKYLDAYIDSIVSIKKDSYLENPSAKCENMLTEKITSLEKCTKSSTPIKSIKRSDLIEEKMKSFDEMPTIDLTSSRFALHPPLGTSTIKSSGIIASFQPACKQYQESDENSKWAASLVKNIFVTNNTMSKDNDNETVYKEFSSHSQALKRGMLSQKQSKSFTKERSEKSSEKIRNLLEIFKNLNDSSKPVDPEDNQRKGTYRRAKKLNSFFSSDSQKSPVSSSKANDNAIFVPSNNESGKVKARLENWNNMTESQAKKIGGNHKKKCHQKISDLIAEKIYKFEQKEMLQAYY